MIKQFFRMKIITAAIIVLCWFLFSIMNYLSLIGRISNINLSHRQIFIFNSSGENMLTRKFIEGNILWHDEFWKTYSLVDKILLFNKEYNLKIIKDNRGYYGSK